MKIYTNGQVEILGSILPRERRQYARHAGLYMIKTILGFTK